MSGRFLSPLRVELVGNDVWRLTAPLVYESEVINRVITVPENFVTDFASVPRLPLAYWLFGGVADEAAVIHDFAYSHSGITRKQADDLLYEACRASGVAKWRAWPIFLGVRLFGGSHYSEREESMAP